MSVPWGNSDDSQEFVDLDETPTPEEESEEFKTPDELKIEEIRASRLKNSQFQDDMKARRKFANRAFGITIFWLIALVVFVSLQFTKFFGFSLTEAEFITVVTTTTASVFGFWMLVGSYLFRR
ncbi:hypothetical protein [Asticcacaulis sp.]|uniref:hypothetical protein n=1 Tax=Asticcacaulis sp. TaxID=1872648 RepID=UPI003F7CBFD7